MSATILTEPMAITSISETSSTVESAICECCGLIEDCTTAYIDRIRSRFNGKWICGLCSEAIKDEILRSEALINTEEAMAKHMTFCKKFADSASDPTVHLITAMRQILRRSLDSPRSLENGAKLSRSESCFSPLSR